MKKIYTTLLTLTFAVLSSAQTITIADPNFKNRLLELEVDTDGDGEIQLEEALWVQYLDLSNAGIQSLSGIEQFINLRELNCENNQLTALPLTTLGYLKRLNFSHNNISSIDFDTTNLQELRCAYNQLSAVNIGPATLELDVSYNQLSGLNLPATGYYAYLNISGNLYTSVAIEQLHLENFYCEDTQLIRLDLSQTLSLGETISIKNNPELQSLNLKNNRFDFCDVMGGGCHFYLALSGNPALQHICLDTFEHEGVSGLNELDFFQTLYNFSNISYNEDCGASPSPELSITDWHKNIRWYPNPVAQILHLEAQNSAQIQGYIIYNLMGQKILSQEFSGVITAQIDTSALNTGSYLLEVLSNQGSTVHQIIKL